MAVIQQRQKNQWIQGDRRPVDFHHAPQTSHQKKHECAGGDELQGAFERVSDLDDERNEDECRPDGEQLAQEVVDHVGSFRWP